MENKNQFKKYLIISFIFLLVALCAGVYFREFTKFMGLGHEFTVLGLVHPHLLILGTVFTLLIGFFNVKLLLDDNKLVKVFTISYISSTELASLMLLIRGTLDVLIRTEKMNALSSGMDAMISGISGLAHIILGVSIVAIFIIWIKKFKEETK